MPTKAKAKEIDVDEDLDFQKREWRIERIGWVAMAVLVLLAIIGLFGNGPASQATLNGNGGFEFSYQRFTRNGIASDILVDLPASLVKNGQVSFWMDQNYLQGIQIDDLSPEPESTEVGQGRTTYTFQAKEGTSPLKVKFDITTEILGARKGTVGWGDNQALDFNQIVFP